MQIVMNKTLFEAAIAYLASQNINLASTPVWKEKPFSVELETYTDAGEDIIIDLEEPTKECLQEYINDFAADIDNKVDLWWQDGKPGNGVPFSSKEEQYEDYRAFLDTLRDVVDKWPEKGSEAKAAMEDKHAITRLEQQYADVTKKLRSFLLDSICAALRRLSPPDGNLSLSDFNKESYDTVSILVDADRGYLVSEEVGSLSLWGRNAFTAKTTSGSASGEMMNTSELLAIWHLLEMLIEDQSSSEPEFLIKDGNVCFADNEDED